MKKKQKDNKGLKMALSEIEQNKVAVLIAGTAEIIGQGLNQTAIAIMCEDLAEWEFNDIQAALTACRREVKGRLSLKDIIDRLPKKGDELPSADELWGQVLEYLTDEYKTFVLPEMALIALESTKGGVRELVISKDIVAARKAFIAAYERASQGFNGKVKYAVRLGTDKQNQADTIKTAYLEKKITKEMAAIYLPEIDEILGLLPPHNPENKEKINKFIAGLIDKKTV